MKIKIDDEIKIKTPEFNVAVMTCNVDVFDNKDVTKLIETLENDIEQNINIKEVVNLNIIKDGRDAYKTYGKDPSRYRLAVESLYRRVAKGNKLYRINNVVDLGNVLSMNTRKSVAVLDLDSIEGDILIRLGRETDEYHGIGRGKINVTNIPLYEDAIGPFGSVTSDTERTMIKTTTKSILVFIISFSGEDGLYNEINDAKKLYQDYANGSNFDGYVV